MRNNLSLQRNWIVRESDAASGSREVVAHAWEAVPVPGSVSRSSDGALSEPSYALLRVLVPYATCATHTADRSRAEECAAMPPRQPWSGRKLDVMLVLVLHECRQRSRIFRNGGMLYLVWFSLLLQLSIQGKQKIELITSENYLFYAVSTLTFS